MIPLFKTRRFLPLFAVQFLGAVTDHLFKNAFVMLVTFKTAKELGWETSSAVNLITGLMIAPMILFSAIAGQVADAYEKAKLIRWSKLAEIGIMVLASIGLMKEWPALLFVTVFLAGMQMTFFGPLKYGILPSHLRKEELVDGSAIFEAATFMAILVGTGLGGLALSQIGSNITMHGWVPGALIGMAALGWLASYAIPPAPPTGDPFPVSFDPIRSTRAVLAAARTQTGVWRSMLGISWFWAVGAIWLSFIPPYVANVLKAESITATQFLILFSIGIGVGSMLSARLQKGEINAKYVPLAGGGISLLTGGFVLAQTLPSSIPFEITSLRGLAICGSLFGIGVCGGVFSVPLYTILQAWSEPSQRARNIAANNILNALFMTVGSGLAALMALAEYGGYSILIVIAGLNALVSAYIIRIIPEAAFHTFVRGVMRILFRVEVHGLHYYHEARQRKVIIANHVSYLDALLLSAFLPELPTFAIDTQIAKAWWLRPFLWMVRVYPLDPSNPMAIKSLTKLVKENVPIVIFPEGRLTSTGTIMKVYQGPGLIVMKAEADLVPVQLDGVHFSRFSRLEGKRKLELFPKLTMTLLPPVRIAKPEGSARQARIAAVNRVYELLTEMAVRSENRNLTLFEALLDARDRHGANFKVLEDQTFTPWTYRMLVSKALLLAKSMTAGTSSGETIGLMLPNSAGAVGALFGVMAGSRIPALLNFSSGAKNLISACATAKIRTVWTSGQFVLRGKLQKEVQALEAAGVRVLEIERLQKISIPAAIRLFLGAWIPRVIYLWENQSHRASKATEHQGDRAALILFTSGSSGTPKAVVLSHRNLLANYRQLTSRVDFHRRDRVFNCLPIFHSFGLTGGTLVPLLHGVPLFMYPSPLHYGVIPELVYQTDSTIFFGTNTFLAGYSKKAHPYDFHSVRYVFAGAEKVKESTKKIWAEEFGIRILEGYGSTECSPALCSNTPLFSRAGTVGKFLPGIEYRLEAVPGIPVGGRLWVKGPNIMLGYYLSENPGELVPAPEGWYDTGDIVEVSEDGYVKILGRAKRFAKVAGEMVSLTAVEELAVATWPGMLHAAMAVPHASKGEEVILVTENREPRREELLAMAAERGLPELFVPRTLLTRSIPILGSGKIDYQGLEAEVKMMAATTEGR